MPAVRNFHIGSLITVATKRLVDPDGVPGLQDILTFMTGDRGLTTHQLMPACDVMRPALIAEHPWLENVTIPDDLTIERFVEWATTIAVEAGGIRVTVTAHPELWGDHDPLDDLDAIRNPEDTRPVIIIRTPETPTN